MYPAPYKIGFLVLPDFSHFGLVAATQPLFLANWIAQKKLFEWSVLSADGRPVRSSNGTILSPDRGLSADDGFRTVFVLACFEPKSHASDVRVINWLRRLARFGTEIGGIETGSELVAAAGLLDGRVAAVHWDNLEGFRERYPDVKARSQLYSLEPGRPTCGGGTSVIDLMLSLVEREADRDLVLEVANQMLIGRARAPGEEQRVSDAPREETVHEAVQRALAIMQQTVEEPLSGEEIAQQVGLSPRQLRRQFQRCLGTTVARRYIMIRLAKAHKLLQQTELSVTEVAVSAGFSSLEHFSRVYRSVFGRAPSTDRRQSVTAPVFRPKAGGHAAAP